MDPIPSKRKARERPTAVLYYKDTSNPCLKLLELLNNNPAVNRNFIRSKVNGKNRPNDVHSVPAIRVRDELLVGKDAFHYVYFRVCQEHNMFVGALTVLGLVLSATWIIRYVRSH